MTPLTESEWKDFREMIHLNANEFKHTMVLLKTVDVKNVDKKKIKEIKRTIARITDLTLYFAKRLELSLEMFIDQLKQFEQITSELKNGNTQSINKLNLLHPIFLKIVEEE